jgi:hypothetical protein
MGAESRTPAQTEGWGARLPVRTWAVDAGVGRVATIRPRLKLLPIIT